MPIFSRGVPSEAAAFPSTSGDSSLYMGSSARISRQARKKTRPRNFNGCWPNCPHGTDHRRLSGLRRLFLTQNPQDEIFGNDKSQSALNETVAWDYRSVGGYARENLYSPRSGSKTGADKRGIDFAPSRRKRSSIKA